MIKSRLKRNRKPGGHHRGHGMPALIPMIDMLVILVVYMLVHTADYEILPNTKNISIPQSLSERKPNAAIVVMVTKDSVYVDGRLVGSIADLVANSGNVFAPLKAELVAQNDLALGGAQRTEIAKREVTIMGDKSTPYSVLKKIMMTCSDAEYGKVSFAVVERERAAT